MNKNNKANLSDLLIFPNQEDNQIKSFKQVIPVTVYHFYITDDIGEVAGYLELIQTLKTAEEHDTIFIYLNTAGGMLKTAVQIMSAMKQSNATIITCLEGEVCSAGTMIFLAGSKYLVNPHCTFMVHNYSGGFAGKGHELASHAKYMENYSKQFMTEVYGDFLTAEEITNVLDGRDIWLNSDQVIERLGEKAKDGGDYDVQKLMNKLPELIDNYLCDEEHKTTKDVEPVKTTIPKKSTPKKKPAPKK